MTNLLDIANKNVDLSLKTTELFTKGAIEAMNHQVSAFTEILNSGLEHLKSVQGVQSVDVLVEKQTTYGKDVEEKVRKLVSNNMDTANKTQKKVLSM